MNLLLQQKKKECQKFNNPYLSILSEGKKYINKKYWGLIQAPLMINRPIYHRQAVKNRRNVYMHSFYTLFALGFERSLSIRRLRLLPCTVHETNENQYIYIYNSVFIVIILFRFTYYYNFIVYFCALGNKICSK